MIEDKKFAILIDADNVSAKYIPYILDEISNYGVATYKRIYGDWTKTTSGAWKDVLLENSITPIQQYGYTSGKNATDSAMIIDAMDILYSGNVDGFCIVSSDSDFTKLSSRLRESGMFVVGMGEKKTPKPFIASCNQFKYLEVLMEAENNTIDEDSKVLNSALKANGNRDQMGKVKVSNGSAASENTESKTNASSALKSPENEKNITEINVIRASILKMINESDDKDQSMSMGELGNRLVKRYPEFDVRNYGDSKLSKFLKRFEFLEIHTLGNSTALWVSLKKENAPAQPPVKRNKNYSNRKKKK